MLKNRRTLYFTITLVAFLNTHLAFGQLGNIFKDQKNRYSTVGFGGGSSHYFGDLSPYSRFYYAVYSNVRWNGTVNYQMNFTPRVSARVSASYIRLFGNDATYGGKIANSDNLVRGNRLRNLHFRNDMMEFAVMGLYTFIPLDERKNKNTKLQWSPYVGAGFALLSHDPKARGKIDLSSIPSGATSIPLMPWQSLRSEDTESPVQGYSSIALGFPIALGLKTKLNNNWILSVEGGLRLTLTDFLDDVSSGGYNLSNPLSYRADEDYNALTGRGREELFREMLSGIPGTANAYPSTAHGLTGIGSQPRGSKRNDSYIVTQITLNYIISNRVKCPPLKQ